MPIHASPTPITTARPLRIMVVEDESLVAMDLEERLGRMGYEVAGVADTAEDALAQAQATKIDLALMDIRLRGSVDGIEAAGRLRKLMDIPIVFVTAHADEATLQRAGLVEPFGYVLKPFDERELRAAIEVALHRHRSETRTRKMERWLASTLKSIGDGVIATDAHGRVTFLNAVAEALTGWPRSEALWRPLVEVFAVAEKDAPSATPQLLARAMREGLAITMGGERFLQSRDGRKIPVDESVAPIRDDDGRITGCVVIFRDNTGRLAAEEERRKLQKRMEESQRLESLGAIAGGIAHDFNNLLLAITLNASLGRNMLPEGSPIDPHLAEIEMLSERAAKLCQQMLLYAGQGPMMQEELELSAFARETIQLLQAGAGSPAARLALDLAPGLPQVSADCGQLQQLIINLVTNAAEALDARSDAVVIRTRLFHADRAFLSKCKAGEDLREGDYVLIEVCDSGPGIPADVLPRIFDPFFTTKFAGRGLGLAAVLGIVRSHGGALSVESRIGAGSTFRVLLPPSNVAPESQPQASGPGLKWRSSGTILLVDDEATIRAATSAVLRHLGFDVELAADGRAAIEKVVDRNGEYRALLMDLTMPHLDGRSAVQIIHERFPELPVLLMSGYSERIAHGFFENEGPMAFIQKPFSVQALTAKLAPLLK